MMPRRLVLFVFAVFFSLLPSVHAVASRTLVGIGSITTLGVAVVAGMILKHNKLAPIYEPEPGSLKGKTILITGANVGLGLESAKRLAAGGANVILTTRTDAKGQAAVQAVQAYVQEKTGEQANAIRYKILNLDNLDSIRESVASWDDVPTIDVLMNNAGLMGGPGEPQYTVDGVELSFQSNHLGHFLLTALLQDKLSPKARIINVSSDAHSWVTKLDFDYIWKPAKGEYGFLKSYGMSKLANILFTQELHRRALVANKKWTVVASHPGVVASDFARNPMGKNIDLEKVRKGEGGFWETLFVKTLAAISRSTEQGATTQVWLASSAEGELDLQGKYIVDCKVQKVKQYAEDKEAAKRLWEESEARAGVKFELQTVTMES